MILLYLILTLIAIAILYFAGIAVVYAVCFLIVGFQLVTGKTTIDKLNEKAKQAELKKKTAKTPKAKGNFSFLSYPSPLNNWGLWN